METLKCPLSSIRLVTHAYRYLSNRNATLIHAVSDAVIVLASRSTLVALPNIAQRKRHCLSCCTLPCSALSMVARGLIRSATRHTAKVEAERKH